MAAWRPYWISNRAEMPSQPTLYRDESSLKIWKEISKRCRVIGQTSFFKMAAWRPYLISDRAEMQSQPTLYEDESSLKVWKRYQGVLE